MKWRGLSQLLYENIPFEILMHNPTMFFDVEFIAKNGTILVDLVLEQEDARVARGLASQTTELVENDWVVLHQPSSATPQLSVIAPPMGVTCRGTTSMQLHSTPLASWTTAKSLKATIELQQLAVLVNIVHFEQFLNCKKKKVTQIMPYAMWKRVYAICMHAYPKNILQKETFKERIW